MTFPLSPLLAAFEFGSLSMLGWLVAAALPWLIHRWNRRQSLTTSWAAVDLLLTALGRRSRQVKLQQWLLIAVRTMILVLVTLAVAEPVMQHWAIGSGGSGRSHTVIVLDQSYSMGLRAQGSSRIERAKAQARQLVESRPRGDVFSVIGWAERADNVLGRPTSDASLVLAAIDSLGLTEETAELSTATRAVQASLERADAEASSLDHPDVVFLSDLARNTWLVRPEERSEWDQLAKRASLSIIDVGEGQHDNLAVVQLSVEPAIVLPGQEVSFSATIQGFGENPWNDVDVELSIDNQTVESQQVSLSPAGIATVRFVHQFVGEGSHSVHVSVGEELDRLAIDNHRWLVVEVRPQLRVACVAGQPGSADDVTRALAPGGSSLERLQTIRPEIIPASQLSKLDLTEYDALFLCSATDLNQQEVDQLSRFVQAGGGLAVLLGGQTVAEPIGRLLPVVVHESAPQGDFRFDTLEYAHPIVQPFRGNENAGLSKVSVAKYRRLEVKPERQSAEIALAFDGGDPALVVERRGLGRMAVMAIPCSLATRTAEGSPWSSFAVSPSFLPIVRELLTSLVSARWSDGRNLQVGQTVAWGWEAASGQLRATVRMPDGTQQSLGSLVIEEDGIVHFAETQASGIYQVEQVDKLIARFAVNLDTSDSDLSAIDPKELPQASVSEPNDSSAAGYVANAGYSFAPDLLKVVALLLLVELAFACWLGRGWQ